jgi:hypothetical protein
MEPTSEARLHDDVCDYIRAQYPKALFNSDLSGIKLTMGQSIRAAKLRSSRGWPDIFIPEPRNGYSGLWIELKIAGTRMIKKNGKFATPHIKEQATMIMLLNQRGFYASFALGFVNAKNIIDKYFQGITI